MPNWPWSRRQQSPQQSPAATAVSPAPQAQPSQAQPSQAQPSQAESRPPVQINPMDYSAKPLVLDVVRTERGKFYQIIDVPQNWESPTRSGHWEVRDLVGHMIDVTEGYLTRWDIARRGEDAPQAMGLLVMAKELDRVAVTFRNLPRQECIDRLKASSDRLMTIFDNLTAEQWSGFNVPHVFMGPLPAFFYPAFQIMDYSVHGWDMRMGLGEANAALDERSAGVLVPYMFILLQATVDQNSATDVDATYGIVVDGDWGGTWRASVKDGQFTYEQVADTSGLPAVFHFKDPSEFVLTTYQRIEGGEATGDPEVIDKVRHLYFRI